MNMLKKGPELKLPDLKVPDFLLDVYYDLRERHLLPLVAILLVAMVALPIALSSSSGSDTAESESAVATPSVAVPTSNLVVAKAAPGLRDYRRRLGDRPAKDPFEAQYTTPEGEGATATSSTSESSSSSVESSSTSVETTSTPTETTSPAAPSEGNGEPTDSEHLRYYSFAIDVRVVPVPSAADSSKAEPSVRRNLPELTMLPSREVPALTFMGVTRDAKKALMMVSSNVRGLFGDGVCVVGTETCQLLALEPGLPETIVYGAQERTYRIELLKLRLLTTDRLHKAPLGAPKKNAPKNDG